MSRKMFVIIVIGMLTGLIGQCSTPIEKGNAMFFEGRYTEALRYYSTIFTERMFVDQIPYAIYLSAQCYQKMGNLDMALRALWQLVTDYPDSQWADNAYLELGKIIESQGREKLGDALVLYETIPTRYSRSETLAEALLGAARAKIGMNYPAYALDNVKKVVESLGSFEETAQIHYDIATIWAHPQNPERDIQKAIKHLTIVITRYPHSSFAPDARLYLARLNWEIGNRTEAINFFNEILSKETGTPVTEYAQESIARIYEEIGDLQRAVNAYRIMLIKYNYSDITRQRFETEINRFKGVLTQADSPAISAWSATEDDEGKVIQYVGDVQISIHGGVIRSDTATVNFDQNTISANGNVRINWGDNHLIYCDSMEYKVRLKQADCRGNASRKERTAQKVLEKKSDNILFSFDKGEIISEGK